MCMDRHMIVLCGQLAYTAQVASFIPYVCWLCNWIATSTFPVLPAYNHRWSTCKCIYKASELNEMARKKDKEEQQLWSSWRRPWARHPSLRRSSALPGAIQTPPQWGVCLYRIWQCWAPSQRGMSRSWPLLAALRGRKEAGMEGSCHIMRFFRRKDLCFLFLAATGAGQSCQETK